MDKYEIFYPKYNARQVKTLISHEILLESKAYEKEANFLSNEKDTLNPKKDSAKIKELTEKIAELTSKAKNMLPSNYFTDKSPLWLGWVNGGVMVLPSWQGGEIEIILTRLTA